MLSNWKHNACTQKMWPWSFVKILNQTKNPAPSTIERTKIKSQYTKKKLPKEALIQRN